MEGNQSGDALLRSYEIRLGLVCSAAIVVLWTVTPLVLYSLFPDDIAKRGQFGDLYGSANALFSGLAFAAVFTAILLQWKELRLQREELILQREEIKSNRVELARAASAQEESREALKNSIHAQAFKAAHEVLQASDIRAARRIVYTHLSKRPLDQWIDQEVNYAELVGNAFDFVGTMVRHEMVPIEYIAGNWGNALRQTWQVLQPFVESRRSQRDDEDYWKDYQQLAEAAFDMHEKSRERRLPGRTSPS